MAEIGGSMAGRTFDRLARDNRGGAAIKAAAGASLIALAVATASPEFHAHPVLGKALGLVDDLREAFPRTLDKVTEAMRGR